MIEMELAIEVYDREGEAHEGLVEVEYDPGTLAKTGGPPDEWDPGDPDEVYWSAVRVDCPTDAVFGGEYGHDDFEAYILDCARAQWERERAGP